MADPSPEYPFGKPISVIKPGIPIHAWDDHGEITINDIEAYLNSKSTNVTFKGVFDYQDNLAGIPIDNIKVKGYFIQHTRSGTINEDAYSDIRVYDGEQLILQNNFLLNNDNPYNCMEMFIRNGMWVCNAIDPISDMTMNGNSTNTFYREIEEDHPYITSLLLGTQAAKSGEYRVWLYEWRWWNIWQIILFVQIVDTILILEKRLKRYP